MVFLENFWKVMCELSPWLLLGMLLSGLLHALLPANFIRKNLNGTWGVVKAVAIGVPLPLCSCGVIPAGIGLRNQGASRGAAIGFLISTPQTGVDSIIVAAAFFGWPFAIFKMATAAIMGIVGGVLADRWGGDASQSDAGMPTLNGTAQPPKAGSLPVLQTLPQVPRLEDKGANGTSGAGMGNWIKEVWIHGLSILRSIWLWLVVGVLISASIDTWMPVQWFSTLSEQGVWLSIALVLALSIPLYVCATASVPIAATIVQGGISPAAALVFLIAGPATNVTTIGAIFGRFGVRTGIIYMGTIFFGSVFFAVVFDWLLEANVVDAHAHHQHGRAWWEVSSSILILGMISYFLVHRIRQWTQKSSK